MVKAVEKEKNKSKKKMINGRYLFYGFLALLFGLTVARKLFAGEVLYIVVTVVALAMVLLGLVLTKRFAMLIVIISLFFVGNGLYFWGYSSFRGQTYDEEVAVVGRVSDYIEDHGAVKTFVLDNVSVNGQSESNLWMSVTLDNGGTIKNGDILAFEASLENISLFELGSFQLFYYRHNTAYQTSVNLSDVVISEGGVRYDEKLRASTKELLFANMSEKNAGICYAVLFGDKSEVSKDIKEDYNSVGIIHILTVSGLHVGFLVGLLYWALKKCNKYVKFSILFSVLVLYNVLCGFTPSVLRASIMALVMLLSKLSGREYDPLSSLALAGFLIVLPSPLTALDTGFLMSFFSVAGIFLIFKPLSKLLSKFIPEKIASYIALTLSAQIGILPFVANIFSSYNFLSVFANLFILPIFAFLFPILFVLFVLGTFIPFIGIFLHVVAWIFEVINYIAYIFSSTSLIVDLKPFPIVFNIVLCLGLFVVSYYLMVESVVKWACLALFVLASCITFVVQDFGRTDKNFLEYTDYCYGEMVYAVNDEGQSLLVCDKFSSARFERYTHLRNIKHVDYVITFNESVDAKIFDGYGVKGFGYPSLISMGDKFLEIQEEQECNLGEFSFKFKYFASKCVGVEFSVNNFTNFFTLNGDLSYNICENMVDYLENQDFAFNFLNQQEFLYDANVKGAKLCTYQNKFIPSLEGFGNMKISFDGRYGLDNHKYTLRCID